MKMKGPDGHPASTNPKITERGYQLTLRTIGLDSDQGPTAAKYIIEQVKPQRVAVIHDKKQYGEGIASSVKAALDKAGVRSLPMRGITAGDKDFSALIAKLQRERRLRLLRRLPPELGLILRQAGEGSEGQVHGSGRRGQQGHLRHRRPGFRRPAGDPAEQI